MPQKLAHALAERFAAFRTREDEISAELRTYKAMLDVVPCPMALMTRDGLAEYVNPAYCQMLGVTLEQIVADGWHNVVAEEDRERTVGIWKEVVDNNIANYAAWSILRTPAGSITAYWRSTLLPNGSFAIAIFHPQCAFLRELSNCRCVIVEGTGTLLRV